MIVYSIMVDYTNFDDYCKIIICNVQQYINEKILPNRPLDFREVYFLLNSGYKFGVDKFFCLPVVMCPFSEKNQERIEKIEGTAFFRLLQDEEILKNIILERRGDRVEIEAFLFDDAMDSLSKIFGG